VLGSVAASMQIKGECSGALFKRLPKQINPAHD
jgi:hypothetical protein